MDLSYEKLHYRLSEQMKYEAKFRSVRHVHATGKCWSQSPSPEEIATVLRVFVPLHNKSASVVKSEDFCDYYKSLSTHTRHTLLTVLAEEYNCKRSSAISESLNSLNNKSGSEEAWLKTSQRLRHDLQPQYHSLLVNVGRTQDGVKFLVDMRADVQSLIKSDPDTNVPIRTLDHSLLDLLSLWFSVGMLQLERLTWQSSCDLIQKISEHEAVHPVRSWADIKQRLGPYRRCYVFTHRCMPREPVVVLHAALMDHISHSIHDIVSYHSVHSHSESVRHTRMHEEEDPSKINTAIFYSITATQKGLAGIELGHHLIKQAVTALQAEFPTMQQFSSLSPIPGFTDWLLLAINRAIANRDPKNSTHLIQPSELQRLCDVFNTSDTSACLGDVRSVLHDHSWVHNEDMKAALERPLMRLCARYLYLEKRRRYALNPVANFHLTNGAVLWRLNWLADHSQRGLTNSCGLMVNYRYYLDECAHNTRAYVENQHITVSQQFLDLIKDGV